MNALSFLALLNNIYIVVLLKFILEECLMALLKDITFTGNLPQTTHILQV